MAAVVGRPNPHGWKQNIHSLETKHPFALVFIAAAAGRPGTTVCAQVAAAESKATHARMADFLARFAPAMGSFQVHAHLPARARTHACMRARAHARAIACDRRMDCAASGVLGGGRRLERVLVGLRPAALVSAGLAVVVLAATYTAARNIYCNVCDLRCCSAGACGV